MNLRSDLARIGCFGLAVTVLCVCGVASGQEVAPQPPPRPDVFYRTMGPGLGPGMPEDAVVFIGVEAELGGKTVTGSPFSASYSSETKQVLADGNQIVHNSSGTFTRDSQGRTRREMTLPAIGPLAASGQVAPHVVLINDPVAGAQYVLQPDRKVARKTQLSGRGKHARNGADEAPLTRRGGQGGQENVATVSLGTQTIDGVQAEGTRTTRTIPAGAVGNTNPIVITVERWYSADLQTVVMMKRSDPRMGETIFQLTNIQRQEPDISLFQVPADYTVRQGGARQFNRRMPPPEGAPVAPPPPQD
jgi:hypothetical protein